MTKKVKIILAISGGALVGGIGVCGIIWPEYGVLCASASSLIALSVATVTGVTITKE